MLPCGDFLCLSCYESRLEEVDGQTTVDCPKDNEKVVIPAKLKENVRELKIRSLALWIHCDKH